MLANLLNKCDSRYQQKKCNGNCCNSCTYNSFCPNSTNLCGECLKLVHFPNLVQQGAPQRKYDCQTMADYYVCKYSYKYTSEVIYAIKDLVGLKDLSHINVLSFGAGPCTDLLALDFLKQSKQYQFCSLNYVGVEYAQNVWRNIHTDMYNYGKLNGYNISFNYIDACTFIDTINNMEYTPNIVFFQYFFSDMQKNSGGQKTSDFVKKFSDFVSQKMPNNSYVVFNDINLSIAYRGGREYFDRFLDNVNGGKYIKRHFHNDNKPNTYNYGNKATSNSLYYKTEDMIFYVPFTSCSSAQLIYKKDDVII